MMYICVCVCVCVCVRERERERERDDVHLCVCVCVCVCVREREREREMMYICVCVCERANMPVSQCGRVARAEKIVCLLCAYIITNYLHIITVMSPHTRKPSEAERRLIISNYMHTSRSSTSSVTAAVFN